MSPNAPLRPKALARRRVLQGGALLGAGVLSGCASTAGGCDDALDIALAATPDLTLDLTGLPYRQDDPRWSSDLMWDRSKVLRAAVELNGETPENAAALMRAFPDGNSIGNEGCQLTCLAMALRLLMPDVDEPFTPRVLNELAHDFYYYTLSGLSLTTLYGDLVSDASEGVVQLALKEEWLPGVAPWPPMTSSSSPLLRAYRRLPPAKRSQFVLMLKTGTYDDTVASHYVLLHPLDDAGPDDDDPLLLDPAQPLDDHRPWRLSDSAAQVTSDEDILEAWNNAGIAPTQVGGVWVFVRWNDARDRSLLSPLVHAWAQELARGP